MGGGFLPRRFIRGNRSKFDLHFDGPATSTTHTSRYSAVRRKNERALIAHPSARFVMAECGNESSRTEGGGRIGPMVNVQGEIDNLSFAGVICLDTLLLFEKNTGSARHLPYKFVSRGDRRKKLA